MFWFLTAAGLLSAAAAPTEVRKVDHFVEVNGSRYRVTVRGDQFIVNKKAALVRNSIEERDAQRAAVRLATGCEPVDEFQNPPRLTGKLKCRPTGEVPIKVATPQ